MLSGSSRHLLCGGQGGRRREREGKLKSFTGWQCSLWKSHFSSALHIYKAHGKCMFSQNSLFKSFFKSVIILLESSLSEPKIEVSKETLNSALGGL